MALVPGTDLGGYQILEQIGQGGMATVYKAFQVSLGRPVAVKVLPDYLAGQPGFKERFEREAKSVAGLRHPSIVIVIDYGESDGVRYIVNDFIDGGVLSDQLGSALPVSYVTQTLGPVADALDYAHARGIVHRDVKPSNILMGRDGKPYLGDFGLATILGPRTGLSDPGMVVGTPEYMAPEQYTSGEAGPAADQYALAVVAYEMLTGKPPFSAVTPAAVIVARLSEPLPPPRQVNPDISPEVEQALLKGLAKEPSDRYRSCSEFVRALEATPLAAPVVRPDPVPPTPQPTPTPTPAPPAPVDRPGRRSPALLVAAALVALLVVGSLGFVAYSRLTAAPAPPLPSPIAPGAKVGTWAAWTHVPAVFDVQGPLLDGSFYAGGGADLYRISPTGQATKLAAGVFQGGEPYFALSTGQAVSGAACDFAVGDVFTIHAKPVSVFRIDRQGHASQFAAITGVGGLNGIVFDTTGGFGHRLLVTGAANGKETVYAIDPCGKVQVITTKSPVFEGGLAVAPAHFGGFGGALIGPDEGTGKIIAVRPDGSSAVLAQSGLPGGPDLGVESLGFIPPGFFAKHGVALLADRATAKAKYPGLDYLLRLTTDQLRDAGLREGDLLGATEGGATTVGVRCDTKCIVFKVADGQPTSHAEGHLLLATE